MKAKAIIFLLLVSIVSHGQTLTKESTIELSETPRAVSIDRQGNLYVGYANGRIEKRDRSGNVINHFSPQKQGSPRLIEAWQGLRVFIYYQNFQEYLFLNRFLSESDRYPIDANRLSTFSGLATIAGDNNLWLIDTQTWFLLKLDVNNNEILLENNLNLTLQFEALDISFIREYQNRLFIADRTQGILVFDNLGNYLETIEAPGLDFFSFNKDEVIYVSDREFHLIHLYNKQKRRAGLPDSPYQFILMENNQVFAFTRKNLDIFNLSWN